MTTPAAPHPLAPWLQAQCRHLLAQRGHAWLLQGPSGMGQLDLSLALVRAWLCDQPGPHGACGHCESCHAIDVHTHADLCVLMPEADMLAQGWPLEEKAQAEIDDKKRKPGTEIRVDAMRAAIEFCQRTSARGRGKAVLIHPAQHMNAISANALLKTLEEPPGDVRFVLCTSASHLLLPTIRSRCLAHTMHWPAQADALAWLHSYGIPEDDALHWLRLAGGHPQDALDMARAAPPAQHGSAKAATAKAGTKKTDSQAPTPPGPSLAQLRNLPRTLASADPTALAGMPPPEAVQWLQKLCHDLMCLHQAATPRYFTAQDLPARPPSLRVLARWAKSLAQEARTATHPFNAGLMTEALTAQASAVLRTRG